MKAGFDGQLRTATAHAQERQDRLLPFARRVVRVQAGVQWFGFALFFMNQQAIDQLNTTRGWEIGSGPSLVIVDEGFAKSFTSNTLTSDVYAYIFNQKGLMGGIGLQGSKITRIHPK
jgi:lipid-binding SYLF domain-containing protein